jgi:AcrR family transcriptional regulator
VSSLAFVHWKDGIAITILSMVESSTRVRSVSEEPRPYHHGDVPAVVLAAALDAVDELGPARVGLREVARRAGISHATVTHHFGDKAGVFTAIAADGFRLLAEELGPILQRDEGFLELGVGYVRFAVGHRAHFDVMFRPELYRPDAPEVVAQRRRTAAALYGQAGEISDGGEPSDEADDQTLVAGVAGWSIVHGLAQLWLTGNLPVALGDDPEAITRRVARLLGPRST